MQFLEGGHAKSRLVKASQRDTVLKKVKEVLEWRSQARPTKELEATVQAPDDMMMKIVSSIRT